MPHTWSLSKVLIDVAGKPMLGHVLDQFADVGIDEVIYITGWLGDQVKPYVQANYPQYRARFVVQEESGQPEPCHLAGTKAHQGAVFHRVRRHDLAH